MINKDSMKSFENGTTFNAFPSSINNYNQAYLLVRFQQNQHEDSSDHDLNLSHMTPLRAPFRSYISKRFHGTLFFIHYPEGNDKNVTTRLTSGVIAGHQFLSNDEISWLPGGCHRPYTTKQLQMSDDLCWIQGHTWAHLILRDHMVPITKTKINHAEKAREK